MTPFAEVYVPVVFAGDDGKCGYHCPCGWVTEGYDSKRAAFDAMKSHVGEKVRVV